LLYQKNARTGKRTNYYYLSGSLVAEVDTTISSGTVSNRYQHTDALGSPVVVTNGPHSILERNEYEPYGFVLKGGFADRPGFTGHVSDAKTGLDYMQQRYYDPMCGCFLSVDPVTAYDKPLTNFNRYRYANDNPYKFTDPDGRDGEFDLLKSIVAVGVIDAETPEPTDAAAPVKVAVYTGAILGSAIGGALVYGYNKLVEKSDSVDTRNAIRPERNDSVQQAEHTSGARPSTEEKHQKGQSRKKRDYGGEKADKDRRRPPRKPPPGHKGPWPPKPKFPNRDAL
jgi:RHS repeat-associated protein